MAQCCSPPQTPPGGSAPAVNTSSAPSHPTSSDEALDKCGDSGKRKRFRNKNEKNVALNKLSQLRYRHAADCPSAECAKASGGRPEVITRTVDVRHVPVCAPSSCSVKTPFMAGDPGSLALSLTPAAT